MRTLLLLFALCASAVAYQPNCLTTRVELQSSGFSSTILQVRTNEADLTNSDPLLPYMVDLYVDNLAKNDATHMVRFTPTSGTATYPITSSGYGSAGINIKDGNPHTFAADIETSAGIIPCKTGFPLYFQWDSVNGVGFNPRPLYSASFGGTKADPSGALYGTPNVAVWVDVLQSFLMGSGPTVQCSDGAGHNIYTDGTAGHYMIARGIPCSMAVYCSNGGGSQQLTSSAMATFFNGCTLEPSTAIINALMWMAPSEVTGINTTTVTGNMSNQMESVAWYIAKNSAAHTTVTTGSDIIIASGVLGQGDQLTDNGSNGYAFTSQTDPRACCGIIPTFNMVKAVCTSCGTFNSGWTPSQSLTNAMVDAAVAGDLSAPTNSNVWWPENTGLFLSSAANGMAGPSITGSQIAPAAYNMTVNHGVSNTATLTATNILGYAFPNNYGSTSSISCTVAMTCYVAEYVSAPGAINGGLNPSILQALAMGAVFTCGSIIEPYGSLPGRYPDMPGLMSYIGSGGDYAEGVYKNANNPALMNCFGDGLSHPYPNSFASGATGTPPSGGTGSGTSIHPGTMIGDLRWLPSPPFLINAIQRLVAVLR